jgi:cell wall assembly regulator SMI1
MGEQVSRGAEEILSRFDAARFDRAWARYTAKGAEVHAPFMSCLDKGASEDEIALAERAVGCLFPPDLRHLLSLHNGSKEYQVLPGWALFSAQRIVDEWKCWEGLYHTQFKPEKYDCEPAGPIQGDEWWRLRWIPFCGDGGGNHLCVDMDPADGGRVGQVITMWHDQADRKIVADTLTEFIEIIAQDFEDGELTWDEEWGGVYETQRGE